MISLSCCLFLCLAVNIGVNHDFALVSTGLLLCQPVGNALLLLSLMSMLSSWVISTTKALYLMTTEAVKCKGFAVLVTQYGWHPPSSPDKVPIVAVLISSESTADYRDLQKRSPVVAWTVNLFSIMHQTKEPLDLLHSTSYILCDNNSHHLHMKDVMATATASVQL